MFTTAEVVGSYPFVALKDISAEDRDSLRVKIGSQLKLVSGYKYLWRNNFESFKRRLVSNTLIQGKFAIKSTRPRQTDKWPF